MLQPATNISHDGLIPWVSRQVHLPPAPQWVPWVPWTAQSRPARPRSIGWKGGGRQHGTRRKTGVSWKYCSLVRLVCTNRGHIPEICLSESIAITPSHPAKCCEVSLPRPTSSASMLSKNNPLIVKHNAHIAHMRIWYGIRWHGNVKPSYHHHYPIFTSSCQHVQCWAYFALEFAQRALCQYPSVIPHNMENWQTRESHWLLGGSSHLITG